MDEIVTAFHNRLLQSCSYLIARRDCCWLVDCGDAEPIKDRLTGNALALKGIFLTHCHHDHVYGLNDILDLNPHVPVFCSKLTAMGLGDAKMNLSYITPEYPFAFKYEQNVHILCQGKREVAGLQIEALSTPGHSDDCMTYIVGNNIFTGDSYIPFARVFTKWPRSDKRLAFENEHKLKEIILKNKLNVYCGHWQ